MNDKSFDLLHIQHLSQITGQKSLNGEATNYRLKVI